MSPNRRKNPSSADSSPYPDTGDDPGLEPDRRSTTRTSRWQKVVGIIGLVVVLWVGNGIFGPGGGGPGPGGHGPGGGDTVENQEQEIDTDDGGGMHDPSERDHP